ncbi:acyl-CoA/acyl-ACP dehydrogenase [Candidatus Sumerlaeota bacterium]|nr:acyl-CoA/acyl-ACP dehydrogenase [Candidatus Sumerlaeota bacterium]
MTTERDTQTVSTLRTLPGDEVRQLMWRFAERYDLHMVVQSARSVARGPIAQMVANGLRNTHEWTPEKAEMLRHFDEQGLTSVFMEPHQGGYIEGPKNMATALLAFELAWVDAGAATCSLAGNLALAPIHERGTPEQLDEYMRKACPPQPGEDRTIRRGAFALTEPLPYVGVDTGLMSGRISVAEWNEGEEPILQVEKRGRFITNMPFAHWVAAAVDTGDERIKSSCMVLLEDTDPGTFDAGAPTLKMVHQLSATSDPIFSLRVPASRIIGGYTVKGGVIVPNFNHSDVIEAVFRRTRVTVAVMTSAKLLSAVEPIIRYQRGRFRGSSISETSPRYELGIQQREDALHRLIDVWATGEASASLGFEAARLFDEFDPLEREVQSHFAEQGIRGRKQMMALRRLNPQVVEMINLRARSSGERDAERLAELEADPMVRYIHLEALTNVLCPASKLWNTGHGATMMREAVSLMGGYGITEDCPGFLGHKWMDAQLEATYEGPEAVQRRQLSVTMINGVFLAQMKRWTEQMRTIAALRPGTGACALATGMQLWLWTINHLQVTDDAEGEKLYHGQRQGVTFPLADALCWLLAARQLILDTIELETKGLENPVVAEGLEGLSAFYRDLCHVMTARSIGEVGRLCAELVHGYNRHPAWDEASCGGCFDTRELDGLEATMPGIAAEAESLSDVIDGDEHPAKAGPCVRFTGLEEFQRIRLKMDGCLTGARLAKDRAARAAARVMIPEALDYPV